MTERIGALVLAGGRSSRFGRDKMLEPLDGRPLVEHALDAVRAVASDIIVVTSPWASPRWLAGGVEVVRDASAFEGPLAGLATGLAALDPAIEPVVVVGGDMPMLVTAVLERLLAGIERREAAVLADEDGPRPLPMAIRRSSAEAAVQRLLDTDERRLRSILEQLDVEVIAPAIWRELDPDGATLRDVDVPADLP
jgi:molybdopterin-guanine dinucleotide biosynthesis protein A